MVDRHDQVTDLRCRLTSTPQDQHLLWLQSLSDDVQENLGQATGIDLAVELLGERGEVANETAEKLLVLFDGPQTLLNLGRKASELTFTFELAGGLLEFIAQAEIGAHQQAQRKTPRGG